MIDTVISSIRKVGYPTNRLKRENRYMEDRKTKTRRPLRNIRFIIDYIVSYIK
jgi:hypothetical protein